MAEEITIENFQKELTALLNKYSTFIEVQGNNIVMSHSDKKINAIVGVPARGTSKDRILVSKLKN